MGAEKKPSFPVYEIGVLRPFVARGPSPPNRHDSQIAAPLQARRVFHPEGIRLSSPRFGARAACAETIRRPDCTEQGASQENRMSGSGTARGGAKRRRRVLLVGVSALANAAVMGVCAACQRPKRGTRLARGFSHYTILRPPKAGVSVGYEKETATLKFSFLILFDADTESSSRFLRVLLSLGLALDVLFRVFISSSIVV